MTLFRNSPRFEWLLALVCKSILVLLILSECCTAQKPPATPSSIYERTHLSIVVVVTADKDAKPVGQGSGFIVGKNKIVTNHHVIDGAAAAIVVFADGKTSEVEGVIADSPTRDLTILAVNTGTRAALRFGDELSVRQGDSVYAVGAPRGLELSMTNGIVSGFRHIDEEFVIQNTAPIAPGSSGGPLFDRDGRVIGVTTSLLTDSPGIYFSIGAGDVRRLLRTPNVVIAPLIGHIQSEESASKSTPPSNSEVNVASPNKSSLHVSSNPPSAIVFVNGIKQSGQTPLDLFLPIGRYNVALRLPGYVSYAGNVEIKEGGSLLEADLQPEAIEDVSGTYRGTMRNLSGVTASFAIFVTQSTKNVSGCMKVERPLYGSGFVSGTVDGNNLSFVTRAELYQLSFHGKKNGQRISGKYIVTSQIVKDGEFELEKISSEALNFNVNKCPYD